MNKHYNEIMNLSESEDLKNYVKKCETLSENIKLNKSAQVPLPALLLISEPGINQTHILKLLSGYLESKQNLLSFSGKRKYLEFTAGYCPADSITNGNFHELSLLCGALREAAGYKPDFNGIISINFDAWIGHEEEEYFDIFLEYLADHSDNMLIILALTKNEDTDTRNFERISAQKINFEKIELKHPDIKASLNIILNHIKKYSLIINNEASGILQKTIKYLIANNSLNGHETLTILSEKLAYTALSSENLTNEITKDIVLHFSPKSEYVKGLIRNNENSTKNISKPVLGFR